MVQAPCQIPPPYSMALLNHASLHPAVSPSHLAVPSERCSPALALIHKPPHSAPPPVRQSSMLLGWHTRCPWSKPCWTPQRGLPPHIFATPDFLGFLSHQAGSCLCAFAHNVSCLEGSSSARLPGKLLFILQSPVQISPPLKCPVTLSMGSLTVDRCWSLLQLLPL